MKIILQDRDGVAYIEREVIDQPSLLELIEDALKGLKLPLGGKLAVVPDKPKVQ